MSISSPIAVSRVWIAVSTTGLFDKCANNCVLYREHVVVIPLPKRSRRWIGEPTKLYELADKKWQMIFARYEPCINEPAKAKSLEFKSKLNVGDPFDLNLPKRTSVQRSYVRTSPPFQRCGSIHKWQCFSIIPFGRHRLETTNRVWLGFRVHVTNYCTNIQVLILLWSLVGNVWSSFLYQS